jgi:hypothetical protein
MALFATIHLKILKNIHPEFKPWDLHKTSLSHVTSQVIATGDGYLLKKLWAPFPGRLLAF